MNDADLNVVGAVGLCGIGPVQGSGAGGDAFYIEIRAVEAVEGGNELRQGASAGWSCVNVHNGRIPSQSQIARRTVWAAGLQSKHGAGGVGVDGAAQTIDPRLRNSP